MGIEEIEKRLSAIEERNKRVELDKAWVDSSFLNALMGDGVG